MVATLADHSAVIVESKYMEHNHELDPEGTSTIHILPPVLVFFANLVFFIFCRGARCLDEE